VENYSTHKHQKVRRWLQRHPRFHLHFTPTSASWMNMVECFFRNLSQQNLSQQAILPGSFGSVTELVDAINRYLSDITWNQNATSGMPTAEQFSTKSAYAEFWRAQMSEYRLSEIGLTPQARDRLLNGADFVETGTMCICLPCQDALLTGLWGLLNREFLDRLLTRTGFEPVFKLLSTRLRFYQESRYQRSQ
jgi:DDE superfamily endonuclease